MKNNAKSSAFTLVELSLVLVIIGLIVGGVFVGRDLIKVAQLRSAMSEAESFHIAAKAFRLKYNCLPGDCMGSNFFSGGPNGDGNGIIGNVPFYWSGFEPLYFWQHLALANLIPRNYSSTAVGTTWKPDINYPSSKLGGGYGLANMTPYANGNVTGGNLLYPANYGYVLMLGGAYGDLTSVVPLWPGISGNDAYLMDVKFDDGNPATGRIMSWMPLAYTPYCTTTTNPATATYVRTDTTDCALFFTNFF